MGPTASALSPSRPSQAIHDLVQLLGDGACRDIALGLEQRGVKRIAQGDQGGQVGGLFDLYLHDISAQAEVLADDVGIEVIKPLVGLDLFSGVRGFLLAGPVGIAGSLLSSRLRRLHAAHGIQREQVAVFRGGWCAVAAFEGRTWRLRRLRGLRLGQHVDKLLFQQDVKGLWAYAHAAHLRQQFLLAPFPVHDQQQRAQLVVELACTALDLIMPRVRLPVDRVDHVSLPCYVSAAFARYPLSCAADYRHFLP